MRKVSSLHRLLLPVLLSFCSHSPPFFLGCSRFFWSCRHPSSIQRTQLALQKQLLRNPSHARCSFCSYNEVLSTGARFQNPSFIIQGNDRVVKPVIGQAFADPSHGELDKPDVQNLDYGQQEQMARTYPPEDVFSVQKQNFHDGKPLPNPPYEPYNQCFSHETIHRQVSSKAGYGDNKHNQRSFYGQQEESKSTAVFEQTHSYSARRILHWLEQMHNQADPSTYSSLLQFCSNFESLSDGKFVHDHIISHGLEQHGNLGALLLEMYCKCEALEDALSLFSKMQIPCEAPSWNVLLKTLKEQGEQKAVLEFFEKMQVQGVLPDKVTYISLISVCAALGDPHIGVLMHARIAFSEMASDIIVGTAVINMYAKCGRIADAGRLFDHMPDRNVITWTAFITAHTHHDEGKESLQLFHQMHQECQVPNRVTYVNTISACAGLEDLASGRQVHALMLCNEVDSDIVVTTAVANMYGKCGSWKDALEVLHECPERNAVTWNAIITALVHCNQGEKAVTQFLQMQQDGILPDKITLISTVDACSNLAVVKQGKCIHACMMGSESRFDVRLGNALINMYNKCGMLGDARQVFEEMPNRNLVSWNTIITAYAQNKHGKDACWLFDQMGQEGILADKISLYGYLDGCGAEKALAQGIRMHAGVLGSDTVSLDGFLVTGLITMYGKCGSLKDAQDTFDNFLEHNVITQNALIAAYAQHGEERIALQLFDQLLWEGLNSSEATFVGLLNAFSSPASLAAGKRIHTIIIGCGYDLDNIVGNALMNMYSKCGSLASANTVFDKLSGRDVISWTTIVGVYGEHGQGRMALQYFDQMLKSIAPDEVTFLNVLTACNRSGLVEDGNFWFKSMSKDYGITPNEDHYSCMVDLFGRAGRLEEAENLMKEMSFEPSYTAWIAFLGACRYANDVKSAEFVAQHLFATCPENHQPYVLLSNTYAAAGRKDDAARVMSLMRT